MAEDSRRQLDQETRELLQQIAKRVAYRQIVLIDITGRGIGFVSSVDEKRRFAEALRQHVALLGEIERLHADTGGGDLDASLRERLERVPLPDSRLELATCLALLGRAGRVAALSFFESDVPEVAAVARTLLEAPRGAQEAEERVLVDFCLEASSRATAQRYWERWLRFSLLSFGRPGTAADQRAVTLGLRSKRVADVVRDYLRDVSGLLRDCGLAPPALEDFGVELPEDLRARFTASGL